MRGIGAALALLAAGAGIGWAVTTTLAPASAPGRTASYTHVVVRPGSVGSSMELNVVAQWSSSAVGTNEAAGVVTGVAASSGDEVTQGAVLYRVAERPVVVAEGSVPAFRAIGEGVTGEDVAQLQRMLGALGFSSGSADGEAGPATASAVRAWQRSLGMAATGVVELGDVIFVPSLPARVSIDTDVIARGARVAGGESVVNMLTAPRFRIPVTDTQAAAIPAGSRVELTSPDGDSWEAVTAGQTRDDDAGTVDIALEPVADAGICGEGCPQIPIAGDTLLRARIVTLPEVGGLVVPTAALVTDADGRTGVFDSDGTFVPVEVIASARGMSVIEGVSEGTRVRVPASATPEDAG